MRTRKELFRLAARFGLIDHLEDWFKYGDARNLTSHTYAEKNALLVFQTAEQFILDAQKLLRKLENENASK